ncbi:MAG: hypothetical protein WDW36_004973 [Sanguina aurantia]
MRQPSSAHIPKSGPDALLWRRLFELSRTSFIEVLLSHHPDTFPGSSVLALKIFAFYASWLRLFYTQVHCLSRSQTWVIRMESCGSVPSFSRSLQGWSKEPGTGPEERELAGQLFTDFNRFSSASDAQARAAPQLGSGSDAQQGNETSLVDPNPSSADLPLAELGPGSGSQPHAVTPSADPNNADLPVETASLSHAGHATPPLHYKVDFRGVPGFPGGGPRAVYTLPSEDGGDSDGSEEDDSEDLEGPAVSGSAAQSEKPHMRKESAYDIMMKEQLAKMAANGEADPRARMSREALLWSQGVRLPKEANTLASDGQVGSTATPSAASAAYDIMMKEQLAKMAANGEADPRARMSREALLWSQGVRLPKEANTLASDGQDGGTATPSAASAAYDIMMREQLAKMAANGEADPRARMSREALLWSQGVRFPKGANTLASDGHVGSTATPSAASATAAPLTTAPATSVLGATAAATVTAAAATAARVTAAPSAAAPATALDEDGCRDGYNVTLINKGTGRSSSNGSSSCPSGGSQGVAAAMLMMASGDDATQRGDYSLAIRHYSSAIDVPVEAARLLDEGQRRAGYLTRRAHAYVSRATETVLRSGEYDDNGLLEGFDLGSLGAANRHYQAAVMDCKLALDLVPSNSKALAVLAKAQNLIARSNTLSEERNKVATAPPSPVEQRVALPKPTAKSKAVATSPRIEILASSDVTDSSLPKGSAEAVILPTGETTANRSCKTSGKPEAGKAPAAPVWDELD